jgi:predicted acylesterase/phospholipase RssA
MWVGFSRCSPRSSCGATPAAAAPSSTPCRWWTRCTAHLPGRHRGRRWPPRRIDAVAVTASSYTTGVHWTFCHTARRRRQQPWQRPGRRAEFQPLTIEHLMASSAIPFLFPATPLWVDGRREFFGDGSMRQVSPLSPAVHLGARKVLVIGCRPAGARGLAVPARPARRDWARSPATRWRASSTTRCRPTSNRPSGSRARCASCRARSRRCCRTAHRRAGDPAVESLDGLARATRSCCPPPCAAP